MTQNDPLEIVSSQIGDYTVVRFLGSGAAGHVYEAKRLDEHLALKVYKDWLFETDAESQDARIARESQIGGSLHPNVCRMLEAGRAVINGFERRYLVMEYIDGENLDSLIRRGTFADWRAFVDAARQLLEGVAALHEAGQVHRDIKPANIMVERQTSRIVVADFGVIADLEGSTLLTDGHQFLGTIAYAAPEWLLRSTPDSARSFSIDVYSLGATLFEMLTGQRLFAELRNRHQLARAVQDRVPNLQAPVGFPPGIASLVRSMLAKSGTNRPTLAEVRLRLDELAAWTSEPAVVSNHADADPYERFRQTMRRREDVRLAAEREKLRKERSEEFESMWTNLEKAWTQGIVGLSALSEVVDHRVVWRGRDAIKDWRTNFDELRAAFPDRDWNWGRSFDFQVAAPGIGVQVVYFFHGLDDQRTGVTRFIATLRPWVPDRSATGDKIRVETAESWMETLETAIECAVSDVPHAELLVITLLNEINVPDSLRVPPISK